MNTLLKRPRSRSALAGLARVEDNPVTRRVALNALGSMLEQQFSPTAARNLTTLYELRVLGPGGALEAAYALAIDAGVLTVTRRAAPEAVAWVAVGLGDMIRLVTGETTVWALMAAKRLEVGGEPFTALRFPPLFHL